MPLSGVASIWYCTTVVTHPCRGRLLSRLSSQNAPVVHSTSVFSRPKLHQYRTAVEPSLHSRRVRLAINQHLGSRFSLSSQLSPNPPPQNLPHRNGSSAHSYSAVRQPDKTQKPAASQPKYIHGHALLAAFRCIQTEQMRVSVCFFQIRLWEHSCCCRVGSPHAPGNNEWK